MNQSNAENLAYSFEYLAKAIQARLEMHFSKKNTDDVILESLAYYDDGSSFSQFIAKQQPSFEEYIILLLVLVPHVQPGFLDQVIKQALKTSGDFPELGGARDNEKRIFFPTGETALFVLAGNDLEKRFVVQSLFASDHWFAQQSILKLELAKEGEPIMSGRLLMSPDYIELFTIGYISKPNFSAAFPAKEISTELQWDDLVLSDVVHEKIDEIKNWVEYQQVLMQDWDMQKKLKPGFRALFYGAPGTGKTLTASLLGKYTDRSVFRVDLSTVVSKYIGETEKNLAALFDKASNRDWILFFDEADALFGKRTDIKDSHDRFANQEISFLLQKVEEFSGLVILASNFKANMDDAFLRRFNTVIQFSYPDSNERTQIWRKAFPEQIKFELDQDIPCAVSGFELTGGGIINAVQYACIQSIAVRQDKTIYLADVLRGIEKEYEKEGRVFKNLAETAH